MVKVLRTTSDNPAFISLVKLLDAELAIVDGNEHAFYSQFNKTDKLKHVVVAFDGDQYLGCGAIREYRPDTMEIKRMFVVPESRKLGVASEVLAALEQWALELSFAKCILETGKKQPAAISLYKKRGYKQIPNYGQYEGMDNSVCFVKYLN